MKKISFTVPVEHLEKVKDAMFEAGAGKYERYDRQCWQTLGQAEFRPLEGANPHTGQMGKLEKVKEYKVEIYCLEENVDNAVRAMLEAHPYEGPQYEVYRIENHLTLKKSR